MSREEIIPQLETRGIQLTELKYSQPTASVYQGTFQSNIVAIKILTLTPGAESAILEQECLTQKLLAHPNILPLYDCFWETNGTSHFYVIVTEWCESDLGKLLKKRAEESHPWEEDELWDLIRHLVDALAYMQKSEFTHKNIKPENIFLTSLQVFKLGDFGTTHIFRSDLLSASVTDIPFNLSPILRKAVLADNPQVVHNPFKSDVYALGLTLLSLALLGPPLSLAREDLTDKEVAELIGTLSYSYLFKSMIVWMLLIDEKSRCDFKILSAWLEHYVPKPDPPIGTPIVAPGEIIPGLKLMSGQTDEANKRGNDLRVSSAKNTGKEASGTSDSKKFKINDSEERFKGEARTHRKDPTSSNSCCSGSCSCW